MIARRTENRSVDRALSIGAEVRHDLVGVRGIGASHVEIAAPLNSRAAHLRSVERCLDSVGLDQALEDEDFRVRTGEHHCGHIVACHTDLLRPNSAEAGLKTRLYRPTSSAARTRRACCRSSAA